jgi:hypothetical protein
MKRWQRWAAGLGFALVTLGVAVAPFPLLLLPNPAPVKVSQAAVQSQPGVYVKTGGEIWHVFPRAEDVDEFPKDALRAGPDVVVLVRARQLDDISRYSITRWPDDHVVAATVKPASSRLLAIAPSAALPAGTYCARVSRDGLEGGTDYVYFSVGSGGARLSSEVSSR